MNSVVKNDAKWSVTVLLERIDDDEGPMFLLKDPNNDQNVKQVMEEFDALGPGDRAIIYDPQSQTFFLDTETSFPLKNVMGKDEDGNICPTVEYLLPLGSRMIVQIEFDLVRMRSHIEQIDLLQSFRSEKVGRKWFVECPSLKRISTFDYAIDPSDVGFVTLLDELRSKGLECDFFKREQPNVLTLSKTAFFPQSPDRANCPIGGYLNLEFTFNEKTGEFEEFRVQRSDILE